MQFFLYFWVTVDGGVFIIGKLVSHDSGDSHGGYGGDLCFIEASVI